MEISRRFLPNQVVVCTLVSVLKSKSVLEPVNKKFVPVDIVENSPV